MHIIFFGSDPWFSPPVLQAILKAGIEVALIVTKGNAFVAPKSKIKNQKSKIIQAKAENDISRRRLENLLRSDFAAARSDLLAPDAIILASFGPPFLPAEVLKWPKYGCLNVHASLLPRWRGASPVFAAIAAGDKETGVSIMRMTEEIDRGPVLGWKKTMIFQPSSGLWVVGCGSSREGEGEKNSSPSSFPDSQLTTHNSQLALYDTRETLTKRLGKLGGELIVETLKKLEKGQITEVKQPAKSPTPYTRRLTKDSGRIDWEKSPVEIERFIRAVTPWPGAWAEFRAKGQGLKDKGKQGEIKILKAHISAFSSLSPNPLAFGPFLVIDEVQLPGKNPISWKQFLAGHPGAVLK